MAKTKSNQKVFTVAEANATLPLLRAILRDVTALAHDLRDRQRRLERLQNAGALDRAHEEEIQGILAEFERGQEKMAEYEKELRGLNVELKDYFSGLIDFPSLRDGRIVYLCWKLGESEVAHWHELWAAFSGRQPLIPLGTPVSQAP